MTARPQSTAKARRARLLRVALARLISAKGRFRGGILGRLSHAIGHVTRVNVLLLARIHVYFDISHAVPLSAQADLGLGQAGGGGGGSGRV